ncbi:glycosyltransferase family 2 protein [Flavobacterium sp. P21]|uniref:glycosyltransferase family 2 protein n=1 Tax=Flavobacterium sp. P21 TaxID=3423948 RepID=UPI003D673D13
MLAIIIPYYKLTFFEATLQSLVDQTDKRFRVFVGNDASPENPSKLICEYQDKLDLVYHNFETNIGSKSLVQQWDRCIALSNEEQWLMILGDDDILSPTCVEDFYNYKDEIEKNKCSVVRYATIEIDENNEVISREYTHPTLEKATDFFYRKIRNKTRSSLSEYIFYKEKYKKYGFFDYDLAWYSDDRAWLEFSESNFIYSINSSIVKFRLSPENISRKEYKEYNKQQAKILFFNFLIFNFLSNFNKEQRRYLLLHYEQMIYRTKKITLLFWPALFWLYLSNLYFLQSIKFTRRFLIYVKNKC